MADSAPSEPDIFLSYAREDEARAHELATALGQRGFSVFWDREVPPGQTWHSYIGEALANAKCVVVAWSRHSIASQWVIEEASEGKDRNVLVPVLFEAVAPPFGFRAIQAADLTNWRPGRRSPAFDSLLGAVQRILGGRAGSGAGAEFSGPPEPASSKAAPKSKPSVRRSTAPTSRGGGSAPAKDQASWWSGTVIALGAGFVVLAIAGAAAVLAWFPWQLADGEIVDLSAPLQISPESSDSSNASRDHGQELSRADDFAWTAVKATGTAEACQQYLEEFPAGRHAEEAFRCLIEGQLEGAAGAAQDIGVSFAEEIRDCADCPEMVLVPAGEFTMGSPPGEPGRDDDEGPRRKVTIAQPFWVGKYEVSFAEWDACVAAGGCSRKPAAGWGRDNRPVINVSWNDAKEYVDWLSQTTEKTYRLLSEAEWEYVARAGSTTAFWWGQDIGRGNANCAGCGSEWDNTKTAPVGIFRANDFGLYDTAGNVWEWVEDCWNDSYDGAPTDGSSWLEDDCSVRVLHGGSWNDEPRFVRSAARDKRDPGGRGRDNGFRVARAPN